MSLPLRKVKESGSSAMQVVNSVGRLLRLRGDSAKKAIAEAGEENAFAFLAELFRGNGLIVAIHSPSSRDRALLLSNPKQPDSIFLIVKLFIGASPVSYDRARQELTAFEEGPGQQYVCSQFSLVSLNGFESAAGRLENYNLSLQDWSSVEDLMAHYSQDKFREPRIQLFAHNKQTYKKVRKMMERSNSVAVVQATGTGKSFLIAKLLQDFTGERKLVMAPSYYVINQIKEHIRWEADKIEFMTYARSMNLSAADVATLKPRMIVLDEFHRCGAEEWGRGVQNIINAYPDAFKFGTSATPVLYLDNGRDMSQELFNGHVAENLSLAQAIVRNILPMPKYVCALYTLAEEMNSLRSKILGSRKNEETKKRLLLELDTFTLDWERSRGIPHVLKKHLQKNMRKFLIFCKDEEHLREMEPLVKKWFKEATDDMPIKSYRVYDGDPNSEANLEDFKNDLSKEYLHLLFSINMLNEGLHVNEVSGVVLLRPTESPNIFYQQIGRCLKVGLNHRPVIFDFVNNFRAIRTHDFLFDLEEARKDWTSQRNDDTLEDRCPKFNVNDEVREITEVFGEIKFKLDTWEEMFERLVAYKNRFGNCRVPSKFDEDISLGKWVYEQRKRNYYDKLNAEQKQKLEELSFEWEYEPRENVDEKWEFFFWQLVDFKQKHGHFRFPADSRLRNYTAYFKKLNKESRLSEEKIKCLNDIGFSISIRDDAPVIREKRLKKLEEFYKINGHCNITKKDDDFSFLVEWLAAIRKQYKNGVLAKPVLNRLNSMGMIWNFKKSQQENKWESKFQMLSEYYRTKRTKILNANHPSRSELWGWCSNQRKAFKAGKISKERINKLNKIGFEWTDVNDAAWDKNFAKLVEFKKKYGHCLVSNKNEKNKQLGIWCSNLRKSYKEGKMPVDRVKRLETIGFSWSPNQDEWQEQYERLVNSLKKYEVKDLYKIDEASHDFVVRQRQKNRQGLLSVQQKGLLEKLRIQWNPFDEQWEMRYVELVNFKKKHGHTRVPFASKEYKQLFSWVSGQRNQYLKKKILAERVKKLNDIGFVWNPTEKKSNAVASR